jgi:hypothetical protein
MKLLAASGMAFPAEEAPLFLKRVHCAWSVNAGTSLSFRDSQVNFADGL